MQSFMYTFKAPSGMHARHAGMLVKAASQYQSDISVTVGDKTVDGKRLLKLMGMGIHQGDLVKVTIEGPDEDAAAIGLKGFFWSNF